MQRYGNLTHSEDKEVETTEDENYTSFLYLWYFSTISRDKTHFYHVRNSVAFPLSLTENERINPEFYTEGTIPWFTKINLYL